MTALDFMSSLPSSQTSGVRGGIGSSFISSLDAPTARTGDSQSSLQDVGTLAEQALDSCESQQGALRRVLKSAVSAVEGADARTRAIESVLRGPGVDISTEAAALLSIQGVDVTSQGTAAMSTETVDDAFSGNSALNTELLGTMTAAEQATWQAVIGGAKFWYIELNSETREDLHKLAPAFLASANPYQGISAGCQSAGCSSHSAVFRSEATLKTVGSGDGNDFALFPLWCAARKGKHLKAEGHDFTVGLGYKPPPSYSIACNEGSAREDGSTGIPTMSTTTIQSDDPEEVRDPDAEEIGDDEEDDTISALRPRQQWCRMPAVMQRIIHPEMACATCTSLVSRGTLGCGLEEAAYEADMKAYLDIASGDHVAYLEDIAAFQAVESWLSAQHTSYGLPAKLSDLDSIERETLAGVYVDSNPGAECLLDTPQSLIAGRLIFELSDAPNLAKVVENFFTLCTGATATGRNKKGLCYKSIPIHRFFKGFVMQGGDVTRKDGSGGESIYGSTLPDPKPPHAKHSYGSLSMASSSSKNSSTSQFFICLCEAGSAAATKKLDGKYYPFGKLVEGEDVLRNLESIVETDKAERPLQKIWIEDCGILG